MFEYCCNISSSEFTHISFTINILGLNKKYGRFTPYWSIICMYAKVNIVKTYVYEKVMFEY